ncbi:MAG: DoxX family membrane protein [Rhodoferax sp.]
MQTVSNASPARPADLFNRVLGLFHGLNAALDALQPAAALLARGYVAEAFFKSGLTKLRDWDTTLALFRDEYKVPLLPPDLAAVMGTGGELVLPVLLLLGLGGRFGALGLSVMNVVAVLSLAEIAPAALQQHITWGVLLAGLALFGSGRWALDTWLLRRWPRLAARH